ncbi:MAG: DUF58 domain-containing protein [Burkholderiales bacterium]|nr:DUF58 domain-containing protein [Burkholderiales bacterium]
MNAPLSPRIADGPTPTSGRAPIVLTQRRVYILPTKQGLLYATMLALMLIGAINYNLGLGYVLTFLLAGLGIIALLHTWRNLAGLAITVGRTEPVFAGDPAVHEIRIDSVVTFVRPSIGVAPPGMPPVFVDVPAQDSCIARISMPTQRRGWQPLDTVRVSTTFPLGLFRAWSNVAIDSVVLAYPRPEADGPPLPAVSGEDAGAGVTGAGSDDFASFRSYSPGDSLKHVAWKAAARSDVLLVKQFAGSAGRERWLEWRDVHPALPLEPALARLARWVLLAEEGGERYGLRLPGTEIAPGGGHDHRDHCLEALALFDGKVTR